MNLRFQRATRWLYPAMLLTALLIAWEIAVHLTDTPTWMLPAPSEIAQAYRDDWPLLMYHTRATLVVVAGGFLIALAAGLITGVLIDISPAIERAVYPILIASQTIPMVVLAPLFLIWFGYGLTPKVLITALVSYFPLAVNTADGLRSGDREHRSLLRSMGASGWQVFRLAKVPAALPSIFSGARIAIALSVTGAVFGELVGAKEGLGYLMNRSAAQFATARVFAAIGILASLGVALFVAVALLEHAVLPWRKYLIEE